MGPNQALFHPTVPICPYRVQQRKCGGALLREQEQAPQKMRKQLLDLFYQPRASSAAISIELHHV